MLRARPEPLAVQFHLLLEGRRIRVKLCFGEPYIRPTANLVNMLQNPTPLHTHTHTHLVDIDTVCLRRSISVLNAEQLSYCTLYCLDT